MTKHDFEFLTGNVDSIAKRLLGCHLERVIDDKKLLVKIVETEAYDQSDAASHTYNGRTVRNDVMFGREGHLYVYFTYGKHYCCNIVTGKEGIGSAVLIRAVEPIQGESEMKNFRQKDGAELTNGPAKLCEALHINLQLNGHNLKNPPLKLIVRNVLGENEIQISKRIGITKAIDLHRRFFIKDNPYVSKAM